MSERKMTFWEKIDNFWYYHKWKLVAISFLVAGIYVAIGYINANTDNKEYDFCLTSVFARPMTPEEYAPDKYLDGIVYDIDQNGEVAVKTGNYYITETADGDNDRMLQGQFEGDLANAKGDVILFDKTNLDRYIKKDIFADISEYMDLSSIPEEDIVYRKDIPVAVRLSDSKILTDMKFVIDNIYVSVMFTPDDADDKILASRALSKQVIEKFIEK